MVEYRMGDMESRFADLIWDNAPINSTELTRLAESILFWKRTTTYTMLKRLCDKGIFQNEAATVTACISRDEFYAGQSRRYVENTFGGSLPRFLASFIGGQTLTDKQADELVRLINNHKEG